MKKRALLAGTIAIIVGLWFVLQPKDSNPVAAQSNPLLNGAMVAVALPSKFSEQEQMGLRAYDAKCAACHGAHAQGQDGISPPLVHQIYEPNHHGDMAFFIAAQNGVRAHHWAFGDMPPVEGITKADVISIVAYVRALQSENGIN